MFGCYWSAVIVWLLLVGCYFLADLVGCYLSAVIGLLLLVRCGRLLLVGCYWSAVIGRMFLGGCYWLDVNGKLSLVGGFGQLLLIGSTPVCSCSNLGSNPGILPTIVHTVTGLWEPERVIIDPMLLNSLLTSIFMFTIT